MHIWAHTKRHTYTHTEHVTSNSWRAFGPRLLGLFGSDCPSGTRDSQSLSPPSFKQKQGTQKKSSILRCLKYQQVLLQIGPGAAARPSPLVPRRRRCQSAGEHSAGHGVQTYWLLTARNMESSAQHDSKDV